MRTELAQIRFAKGYSCRSLASELGVSHSSVSYYEEGRCFPGLDTAYKYARALGLSMERLYHLICEARDASKVS